MNVEQEEHVLSIADRVHARILRKYEKGAKEHGGNLWEENPLDILNFALEEVEDLAVYLYTVKDQLEEILDVEPEEDE